MGALLDRNTVWFIGVALYACSGFSGRQNGVQSLWEPVNGSVLHAQYYANDYLSDLEPYKPRL